MKNNLFDRFGTIPNESGQKKRVRIHQGWWRMNVLNELPGKHPKKDNEDVCNTILNGHQTKKNFLTENSSKAVYQTLQARQKEGAGLMEQDRLFNNLLSSQPLCFNFFGELMADSKFGLKVLQTWWPDLTELKKVIFEFAPKERYTNDNSAFDIAFEVYIGNQSGLIGLECKYTDTFSSTEYDKPVYKEIFNKSSSFATNYDNLKFSKYNQLFRNQLIAEGLIQNNKYDFVRTGLFCYEQDKSAIETGQELKQMLTNPDNFKVITYRNFIENVQLLDLDWQRREWTMLLWARYCGIVLSEPIYQELQN
jgi:hypothetical protein